MSQSKNLYESRRWLLTALQDLSAAQSLSVNGFYAQACFLSQQAGEKAVKAIWFRYDHEPWGHSIQHLVAEFPEASIFPDHDLWVQRAASLDRYYIPTRYPNGLPGLTPGESFFEQDAAIAVANASHFINLAEQVISPSQ